MLVLVWALVLVLALALALSVWVPVSLVPGLTLQLGRDWVAQ
jgi:hypothetical protein